MSNRQIEEWEPQALKRQRQYSRKDFEGILAAVPVEIPWRAKLRLRKALESAASFFQIMRVQHRKPPPSQIADRFENIKKTADRLLDMLGLPVGADSLDMPFSIGSPLKRIAERRGEEIGGYPDYPPTEWVIEGESFSDYHGDLKIRQAALGVRLLRSCAQVAKEEAKADVAKAKDSGAPRHRADAALYGFVMDLAHAYHKAFKRKPGVSRPPPKDGKWGNPSGPFIRFLAACLTPVEKDRSPDSIRELWRRSTDQS